MPCQFVARLSPASPAHHAPQEDPLFSYSSTSANPTIHLSVLSLSTSIPATTWYACRYHVSRARDCRDEAWTLRPHGPNWLWENHSLAWTSGASSRQQQQQQQQYKWRWTDQSHYVGRQVGVLPRHAVDSERLRTRQHLPRVSESKVYLRYILGLVVKSCGVHYYRQRLRYGGKWYIVMFAVRTFGSWRRGCI